MLSVQSSMLYRRMPSSSLANHRSVHHGRIADGCRWHRAGVHATKTYDLLDFGYRMVFWEMKDVPVPTQQRLFGDKDDDNWIRNMGQGTIVRGKKDFGQEPMGPRAVQKYRATSAEVMPVCLIKPVADHAATITYEELQAKATWGVRAVKATGSKLTGAGVRVAVLDTGLDDNYHSHPAFQGINVTAKNFTTEHEGATHDRNGHGTHCLGTILGRPVDGMRIGVAPGITDVLVAKVVPDKANGTSLMLGKALLWAWEEGANIINVSLAYDLAGKLEQLLMQNMAHKEAADKVQQMLANNLMCLERIIALQGGDAMQMPPLVIAACGNSSSVSSKVHVYLPAAAPGVLSVAAVMKSSEGFEVAPFSNVGARLCTPGVAVCSAAAGSTGTGTPLLKVLSGTSMAAPHVAGVAALHWEQARLAGVPDKNIAAEVAEKLGAFATREGFAPGVDAVARGRGLVQAAAE